MPTHPRLRRDLAWRRFVMEGEDAYIFRDDVSQQYTKLDAISGTLALKLDGDVSPAELLQYAREKWPSLEFDEDFIADVLADLKRLKFLDDPFERNAMIQARVHQDRAQINAATFKNIFSIPMGTVNPDRFLTRTHPYVSFLFQRTSVMVGLALFALSVYLVWLNRDHVESSASHVFLGQGQQGLGAFLVWVMMVGTLTIHELGHGYAVKHFGGKVDRLGFIFILGLPCMFCDTSDSHLFPSRKHRAYVALAGTYTELYVATLATIVWWITPTGTPVNQLAYNIVVFASVSGLLVNYNPLIKMDGYFVLSDTLDMPNLQEDAYAYLGYLFRRYLLGVRIEPPFEGRRRKQILATYGTVSVLYSVSIGIVFLTFMRFWLIQSLAFLGALISVAFITWLLYRVLRPAASGLRLWALDRGGWIRRQMVPIIGGAALLAALLFLLPIPGRRAFDAALRPAREVALVAQEALRLEQAWFTAGQAVEEGDLLALLDPDPLALGLAESASEAQRLRVQAAVSRQQGAMGASAAATQLAESREQRAELMERRLSYTEIRAPFRGRVLTAQDPERLGQRLQPGDTVCLVGDFETLRAEVRVTELDLADIVIGAPVRLRLRSEPGRVAHGRVTAVAPAAGSNLYGREYQVWIGFQGGLSQPRGGLTGRVWLSTPARPAASHLLRWFMRFIRSDLWV